MATIASLAVKVSADTRNFNAGIGMSVKSLNSMIKSANSAKLTMNSMKSVLGNSFGGGAIENAVSGLTGMIPVLQTIRGLNAAISLASGGWMAALPLLIAGGTALISLWKSMSSDADNIKSRIDAIAKSTEVWRDKMSGTVSWYKELNNLAKQYHEANMSGAQKYQAKLKEIGEVMDRSAAAEKMQKEFGEKYNQLIAARQSIKTKEGQAEITKQMENLMKDWHAARKEVANSPVLSDAEARSSRRTALAEYRESLGIDGSARKLLESKLELGRAWEQGVITEKEYRSLLKSAAEKYDPVLKEKIKAAEDAAKAERDLVNKFKGMIVSTPAQEFEALSEQLKSIREKLSPLEFEGAKQKLFENFEKQSGFYNDYQKTIEDMKSYDKKLQEYTEKLMSDAAGRGWDENIVLKMIEKKSEELLKGEKKKADGKTSEGKTSENAAAVRGTTAYYEAQNRANQPMLAEAKKQTGRLDSIEKHVRPNPNVRGREIQLVG